MDIVDDCERKKIYRLVTKDLMNNYMIISREIMKDFDIIDSNFQHAGLMNQTLMMERNQIDVSAIQNYRSHRNSNLCAD